MIGAADEYRKTSSCVAHVTDSLKKYLMSENSEINAQLGTEQKKYLTQNFMTFHSFDSRLDLQNFATFR